MLEPMPNSPRTRPRVLVVDDSPDSLWLMSQLLEGRYEVLQASSGRQAMAMANLDPAPDLMLLDIVMPDMDGYEVMRRLRQTPRTASIPIAFMTSLTEQEQQILGRELGAVDYLTKPVDVREVIDRVEAHVRRRQQARRKEVLEERLARTLSPREWQSLFHDAAADSIQLLEGPMFLMLVNSAALNSNAEARSYCQAALTAVVERHGGRLDRCERDVTVVLFDSPQGALDAACELRAAEDGHTLRMLLHDVHAEYACFPGPDGKVEWTLLGGESEAARRALSESPMGVTISAPAYAALRAVLDAPQDGFVFTGRWLGSELARGLLAPLPPTDV